MGIVTRIVERPGGLEYNGGRGPNSGAEVKWVDGFILSTNDPSTAKMFDAATGKYNDDYNKVRVFVLDTQE